MEMYRHATRVDSADVPTEKNLPYSPDQKIIWRVQLNKAKQEQFCF